MFAPKNSLLPPQGEIVPAAPELGDGFAAPAVWDCDGPVDLAAPGALTEAGAVDLDAWDVRLAVGPGVPVPVCTLPSGPVYFPLKKSPFPPTSS
jgi:hypothetical protein